MDSRPDGKDLADLVAASAAAEAAEDREAGSSKRSGKRARIYADHKAMSEVTAGMKAGKYHQVGSHF